MDKWKVKEGAESILTKKCANCDHTEAHHNHILKGKLTNSNCNLCDCKDFKSKPKDRFKGLFQK